MENEDFLNYVRSVLVLERQVYEQKKLLEKISGTKNKYSYSPRKEQVAYGTSGSDALAKCIGLEIVCFVVFVICFLCKSYLALFLDVTAAIGILILSFRDGMADSGENKRIRAINEENEKYNEVMHRKYRLICEQADKEYRAVNRELQQTQNILNKYYDLNIIYSKYRNFVCMASILDYFQSGICTELTGHEGAYRLLEEDMKFRRIEQKLDRITDNQYTMISEIREANRNISSLSNSIEQTTKRIMNNQTEIINRLDTVSYNTEIQQRNTQLLADVVLYDHLLQANS